MNLQLPVVNSRILEPYIARSTHLVPIQSTTKSEESLLPFRGLIWTERLCIRPPRRRYGVALVHRRANVLSLAGEAETGTHNHTTHLAVLFEAGTSFGRFDSVLELLDRLDCCIA
jgi:hypothetical protein